MEKQDDLSLIKARSYRSVLKAGFQLYTGNFRRIFKASWQMVLLYALICGALGTLTSIKLPEITLAVMQQLSAMQGISMETAKQYGGTLIAIPALSLLAIATISLASATILNKLKEHKETGIISAPPHWLMASPRLMGRTLKGVFLTLAIMLIPLLLFIGLLAVADQLSPQFTIRHLNTVIVAFFVCTVIALLFALPLMYVLMKYLMEAPCGYWATLCHNYGRGMCHWGFLFLVFFVSTLLVEILALIIIMPANILSFANQQAHQGLLIGDPLGMPSYMTSLTFATFMLCCFIQFYVTQVTLVHNYYIYGSIETNDYEKNTLH